MKEPVTVLTEGLTEWKVFHALYKKKIIDDSIMEPKPPEDKANITPREGYEQLLERLLSKRKKSGLLNDYINGPFLRRVLLVVDQELLKEPPERAAHIERHFQDFGGRNHIDFWENFRFSPCPGFDNLFLHRSEKLELMLHVSDESGPTENRDFDGYILQLLQGRKKDEIVTELITDKQLTKKLIRKAETEMPALMTANGYPISSSKSWLYFYIAAFQQKKSHAFFAGEVVRHSPDTELRKVFAPLIAAWDALKPRSFK